MTSSFMLYTQILQPTPPPPSHYVNLPSSGGAITAVASRRILSLLLPGDSDSDMGGWIDDVRQWSPVTDEGILCG